MIDWLHELSKDWGSYMRMERSGYPKQSVLQKMMDYRVAIRDLSNREPMNLDKVEADVLEYHWAWKELNYLDRAVLFVMYVETCPWKDKAKMLNMPKSTMYRHRNDAHVRIWQKMIEREGHKIPGISLGTVSA